MGNFVSGSRRVPIYAGAMLAKRARWLVASGLVALGCGGLASGSDSEPGQSSAQPGVHVSYRRVAHRAGPEGPSALCLPSVVTGVECLLLEGRARGSAPCACDESMGLHEPSAAALKASSGTLCDAPGRSACSGLCICERADPLVGLTVDEQCPGALPYLLAIDTEALEVLLSCQASATAEWSGVSQEDRAVGEACVPSLEQEPRISFADGVDALDVGTPQCATGLCLAHRFEGRTDCPYGSVEENGCVEQSGPAGTGQVAAQALNWRSDHAVTCTCRCDAPDPCVCPDDMVCEPLFESLGTVASPARGSYCVYPRPIGLEGQCSQSLQNCDD